jgi:hypothetical protein
MALLTLALGVAANPVQLKNRDVTVTVTVTTPAPQPTCGAAGRSCSPHGCCPGAHLVCQSGVSTLRTVSAETSLTKTMLVAMSCHQDLKVD